MPVVCTLTYNERFYFHKVKSWNMATMSRTGTVTKNISNHHLFSHFSLWLLFTSICLPLSLCVANLHLSPHSPLSLSHRACPPPPPLSVTSSRALSFLFPRPLPPLSSPRSSHLPDEISFCTREIKEEADITLFISPFLSSRVSLSSTAAKWEIRCIHAHGKGGMILSLPLSTFLHPSMFCLHVCVPLVHSLPCFSDLSPPSSRSLLPCLPVVQSDWTAH